MHVRHRLPSDVPVRLDLFDVLQTGGESLLAMPYTARQEQLADPGLDTRPARTPPWYWGRTKHRLNRCLLDDVA